VFVLASAVMVLNEIWHKPIPSLRGLAIMGAGLPLYWIFRKKSPRVTASSS
jgi:hypothetical protein